MRTPASRLLRAALALVLAAAPLCAEDEPQIQVTASEPRPALNEVIQISYTFSDPKSGIRPPQSLALKNLVLVGGPATSTNVVFQNGNVQRSQGFTYYLRAQTTGPAEVGESTWTMGDKAVRAAAYLFEVQPASAAPRRRLNPLEDEDLFGFPGRRVSGFQRERREAFVSFVATPDRTTAFVGEEVVITYELQTQADIEGLEYVEPPKFPNCWAEDLEKPERPKGVAGVVDGRRVTRFTLLRKAVAGLAPGTLELPVATIRLVVRGGDAFDPFSMFNRQVLERSTRPITLKIQPIPGNAAFKGPVGRFDLTAKVDRTSVKVEQAVTLKVRLSGTGNLRTATVEAPQIAVPNARLYPPTVKTETSKGGSRPGGYTEWTYVLVPLSPGALTVPSATLEVFDPGARKIVAKATTPLTLAVEGTAQAELPEQAAVEQAVVAKPTPQKAETVEPAGPALDVTKGTVTIPLWLAAALPGSLLLLGSAVFVARRAVERNKVLLALKPEPGETKERAAARIDRALRDRLVRWDVPEGATTSTMLSRLAERGAPERLRGSVAELLSDLEFLRFAPQLGEYDAKLREVRTKAAKLLIRLK